MINYGGSSNATEGSIYNWRGPGQQSTAVNQQRHKYGMVVNYCA